MAKRAKAPEYVGIFELMDERRVLALIRRANVQPVMGFIVGLQERLDAGASLRQLAPRAWEPAGNFLGGGYGFDARALSNGHFEVRLSIGPRGEAHTFSVEVGFGPRGGLRYYKHLGFAVN